MSDNMQLKGNCLCGGVTVIAEEVKPSVGACHCSMCRKWGGGPFFALEAGSKVRFEGEENVARFNSSEWAERGFCKACGTHLFYHLKQADQYILPAGLFEPGPEMIFDHQIFIDEKPDFYHFANETKNMTGAEVFAMYAPPSD